jgi:hypothetical protein
MLNNVPNVNDTEVSASLDLTKLNATWEVPTTNGQGVIGVDVTGLTGSGATLVSETWVGGMWLPANMLVVGTAGALSMSLTSDASFRTSTAAKRKFRVRVSAIGVGSASLTAVASTNSSIVQLGAPLPPGTNKVGGVDVLTLPAITGSVTVTALPSVDIKTLPAITGSVSISSLPSITGSVSVNAPIDVRSLPAISGSVSISAMPSVDVKTLPAITGSVAVTAIPSIDVKTLPPITGSVAVSSLPSITGSVAVSSLPLVDIKTLPAITGSVTVTAVPSIDIKSLPPISGSVDVATMPSITVANFPSNQTINGTVTVTETASLTVDSGTPGVFAPTPSSLAVNGIVPAVAVGQSALVVKTVPCNFYGAVCLSHPSAGNFYLLALNRTTVPAANAAIATTEFLGATIVPGGGYGVLTPNEIPDRFGTGLVLVCSTSTTTYAPLTTNLPLHLKGRAA